MLNKIANVFFQLEFTTRKHEQSLQGKEFQEKEEKDEKHIEKLFRKNAKMTGAFEL